MSQIDTATADTTEEVEPAPSEGWLPAKVMGEWPSFDTRQLIMKRRKSLYEAMQSLEAAAARASGQPDWMEKVQESLAALLAAINRHIEEIESDDGLFADVLERAPRMRPLVESLREDHDEIKEACRAALDLARDKPDTRPKAMRRRIMRILGRLSMHRQDGAELLFDTHNLDLAAGD